MQKLLLNLVRPKWKNPDSFIRLEAVQKITAQKKLIKIAQNDTDAEVCMAAAARLTDKALAQNIFTDIAKNSSFSWEADAVSKVTDQALLADIAKTARCKTIRMAAAVRLTDNALAQTMFSNIAENDILDSTKAISQVTDQILLAGIAKTGSRGSLRIAAAARLIDKALAQSIFFDIAQHDAFEKIKTEATWNLTDQAMLASLAISTSSESVRLAATRMIEDQVALAGVAKRPSASIAVLEGIADQTLLADVAKMAYSGGIRLAAANKLTDKAIAQTIYADVAENGHWQQRDEAVQLLTDQGLLAEVAKRSSTTKVRLQVADKLTDKALAQRIFADIAKKDDSYSGAAEKITDQILLADVANRADSIKVRIQVAEKLTDKALAQRIFADIAIAEPWGHETPSFDGAFYNREYGEIAFFKLTDMNLLGEVATTAQDELVRNAAARKVCGPLLPPPTRTPQTDTAFDKQRTVISCPVCTQQLSVPTDRGKLHVACPTCHTNFDYEAALPDEAVH